MKTNLPQIGKTYHYFDNGIISESHRYPITITKIIPYNQASQELILEHKEEIAGIENLYNLYNQVTDYFVYGNLDLGDGLYEEVILVRCYKNGWFGLGYYGGRLDIDGTLIELN
jgi:hypothetical protein